MSTRAIQIESLLTGLVHPTTGLQMTGGTAYFYSAGTSNAKNVWTEKEKTNPYTSYALSVIGGAQLYGDGEYKIVVKDADGVTCYTWDNVRLRYPNYYVRAVTATTSQTADDDFLEVNTTTNPVTINMLTVASWVQPLKIMHTAGANAITLEPSGAELVDGAANYTFTSVGTIVEIVADAAGTGLRKAGIRSTTLDADGDTGIELDRTADNDTIYIKTGGVDRMVINSTATDVDALSIGGTLQTTTATEINQLHLQGVVAADFATLHAVASEIAQLDGQGAVAADFAKLHAISASAAEIDAAADGVGVSIPRRLLITFAWDMDTVAAASYFIYNLKGIDHSKIVGAKAWIANSANTSRSDLSRAGYIESTGSGAGSTLTLNRTAGGVFDAAAYSAANVYMIVEYID